MVNPLLPTDLSEATGMLTKEMEEQVLDSMDLERRGITIKLKAVKLFIKAKDKELYMLNLIDTRVTLTLIMKFQEVLLLVRELFWLSMLHKELEIQTLASMLALEQDLELLPVINKIDLPSARIDEVKDEIEDIISIDTDGIPLVSAKRGLNIEDVIRRYSFKCSRSDRR